MNEELFRLYALWTFAISCVYTLIYLGIFLNQYRTAFFIFIAIITVTVLLYWFRDGGNKVGWDSLEDSVFIVLFLSIIMMILMVIACILATKITDTSQVPDEFRPSVMFVIKGSPIVLTLVNFINLLIFIARN